MLQVYICDDSRLVQQQYKEKLQQIADNNMIDIKITAFGSGESLVFHLSEALPEADIIFLDIIMGNLDGIDTARELRALGSYAEIIFLTSSSEYVFESFDVSPANYLLKSSISFDRLEEVFLKAVRKAQTKEQGSFICGSQGNIKQIPIASISFFEVKDRIVSVHYQNKTVDFYSSMEKLEQKLDKKVFARIHRSFIVHLKYIDRIEKNTVVLTTGTLLPLGPTYAKSIKQAFSGYLVRYL